MFAERSFLFNFPFFDYRTFYLFSTNLIRLVNRIGACRIFFIYFFGGNNLLFELLRFDYRIFALFILDPIAKIDFIDGRICVDCVRPWKVFTFRR